MRFRIVITFLIVLACSRLWADTIFLKDGGIIEGTITEKSGNALTVQVDGKVRSINHVDILRVVGSDENFLQETKYERRRAGSLTQKKELAMRLLEANDVQITINRLFAQIIKDAPEDERQRIKELLLSEEIVKRIIPIYAKYYTIAELEALIEFYSSPVGKKHLKMTPIIMDETLRTLMKYFQEELSPDADK